MSSADSPGRTTSSADPVYVFDFDGTVIDVNSFPLWVRHLLRGGPAALGGSTRLKVAVSTAAALAERKALGRSHQVFKHRMQRIWARHAAGRADEDFTRGLVRRVRPELRPLLDLVARGEVDALLATAAAEEYAEDCARQLGFRHYVATPRGRALAEENVGPMKRTTVQDFCVRAGWVGRELVVFTDHLEDEPLVSIAGRLVWCGSSLDADILRSRYPSLQILDVGRASAQELHRFTLATSMAAGHGATS